MTKKAYNCIPCFAIFCTEPSIHKYLICMSRSSSNLKNSSTIRGRSEQSLDNFRSHLGVIKASFAGSKNEFSVEKIKNSLWFELTKTQVAWDSGWPHGLWCWRSRWKWIDLKLYFQIEVSSHSLQFQNVTDHADPHLENKTESNLWQLRKAENIEVITLEYSFIF